MPDSNEHQTYRKRVFLHYLAHPLTIIPAAIGLTGLLGGWAVGSAGIAFGGLVIALAGIGVFLTRLLSDDTSTEEKVIGKMQSESREVRQRELDDLDRLLAKDKDPRDEKALQDLRLLVKTFDDDTSWTHGIDTASQVEIRVGVDRLFKHAEASLRESHEALVKSRDASRKVALTFIKRREHLIDEVEASVQRLQHLLEELQAMRPLSETAEDLRAIREELDTSLEIAKKSAQTVSEWDAHADDRIRE